MKITVDKITNYGTNGKYWLRILESHGVNLYVNVDVITNKVDYSVLRSTTEQFFNTLDEAVDCYNFYLQDQKQQ